MKDQIRAEFEQEFPLPNGVTFDGDHYVADPEVIGSFQNATIWSHMFRGWKTCDQPARQVVEPELISYAEDMSTCTLTLGDGIGYFYSRVTDAELDAKDGHQVCGDEPKPFCWYYKMAGEQRFYHSDPRQADFGVNMSEFISDVEPLFNRAALSPAAVAMPKTELWQCQNTENRNLVYLPYKPQGPWDCVEYVRRDEVARLNRRAIPVVTYQLDGQVIRTADGKYVAELMAYDRDELRALLGKE